MSVFKLGQKSKVELLTVRWDLQRVVNRAIKITGCDFSVIQGKRTIEQQQANIENGVSWTIESDHLPDAGGDVLAVDIYPWFGGRTSHHSDHYKLLAKAMFSAAYREGMEIEWGGLWINQEDKPHWSIAK